MTDQTASLSSFKSEEAQKKLRRRHWAERRFRMYGIAAILFALAFLVFLFTSIFTQGWPAFLQTSVKLPVEFSREVINPSGNPEAEDEIFQANFVKLAREGLYKELGIDPKDRKVRRDANRLLSRGVDVQLRDMVLRDPSIIGTTKDVWLLASDNADALLKGSIDRETPNDRRAVNDEKSAGCFGKAGCNHTARHDARPDRLPGRVTTPRTTEDSYITVPIREDARGRAWNMAPIL